MIDKVDFNVKNHTSNAGLLLVFDRAQRAGVFDWLEERCAKMVECYYTRMDSS